MKRTILNASWLLPCFLFLGLYGCKKAVSPNTSNAPPAKSPTVIHDNAEAVAALAELGAKTKTDSDGYVVEVDFRGTDASDEAMAGLPGLTRLRSVLLAETAITDAALATLGTIPTLTNLDLRECAISNDGLSSLTGLSNLKALKLSGKNGSTTVDDSGMKHVAKLPNLKVIGLDSLWISEVGLEELTTLAKLEEVYIGDTTIGDDAMAIVARLPNLKKLRIAGTTIGDEGIAHLAEVRDLQELDVSSNTVITSASFPYFENFKTLKKLNLWRLNNVTDIDTALQHIAGLTELRWLNLDNTQLTDAGTIHLAGLTNLTFLHLGSTAVSDKGLVNLEGLTSLKDLKVTRTTVTEAGVTELQKSLPNTAIQLEYEGGRQ